MPMSKPSLQSPSIEITVSGSNLALHNSAQMDENHRSLLGTGTQTKSNPSGLSSLFTYSSPSATKFQNLNESNISNPEIKGDKNAELNASLHLEKSVISNAPTSLSIASAAPFPALQVPATLFSVPTVNPQKLVASVNPSDSRTNIKKLSSSAECIKKDLLKSSSPMTLSPVTSLTRFENENNRKFGDFSGAKQDGDQQSIAIEEVSNYISIPDGLSYDDYQNYENLFRSLSPILASSKASQVELSKLNSNIKSLHANLKQRDKNIDKWKKTSNKLLQIIESHKEQSILFDARYTSLEKDTKVFEEAIKRFREINRANKDSDETLSVLIIQKSEEISRLETNINNLNLEIDEANKLLRELEKKLKDTTDGKDALSKSLEIKERDFKAQHYEFDEKLKMIEKSNAQNIIEYQEIIQGLEIRQEDLIKCHKSESAKCHTEKHALQTKLLMVEEQLLKVVTDTKSEADTLNFKIMQLQTELNNQGAKYSSLLLLKTTVDQELFRVSEEKQAVLNNHENIRIKIISMKNEVLQLKNMSAQFYTFMDNVKIATISIIGEMRKYTEIIAQKEKQNTEFEEKIGTLLSEIKQSNQNLEEKCNELDISNERISELVTIQNELHSSHALNTAHSQEENALLTVEIRDLKLKNSILNNDVDESNKSLSHLQSENEKLKIKLSESEAANESLVKDNAMKNEKIQNNMTSAEKMEKQIAELKSTIVELQKTNSSNDKNLQSLAGREIEAKKMLEENNMTWKSLIQSEKMVYENKLLQKNNELKSLKIELKRLLNEKIPKSLSLSQINTINSNNDAEKMMKDVVDGVLNEDNVAIDDSPVLKPKIPAKNQTNESKNSHKSARKSNVSDEFEFQPSQIKKQKRTLKGGDGNRSQRNIVHRSVTTIKKTVTKESAPFNSKRKGSDSTKSGGTEFFDSYSWQ